MQSFVKNSKIVLLSLVVPFLVSCVSTKETPLSSSSVVAGKSLTKTERKKPDFAAVTAVKATGAAFGPIGGAIAGAAMVSSGNAIVNENGVEDPANWISQELAAAMNSKYGMSLKGRKSVTGETPEEIAKACSGADFALDVRTINWSFAYFPANWGTYRVIYSAQLRLIDCRTGTVVAQGFYARVPDKTAESPDYDALVENKAAGLKKEIKIGAQEALHHFKTKILNL